MKKVRASIFCLSLLSIMHLQAQVCKVDTLYTLPGLYPSPDSVDCLIRCKPTDITLQFVNFDSVTYNGLKLRVDYLIIDSIANLPCGISWTTNAQNTANPHHFTNQENGCILFLGFTSDDAGQYELEVFVRAKINLAPNPVPITASSIGLRVFVRVKDTAADPCPAIDTTAGAPNARIATCESTDTIGVTEISSIDPINHFSFYPNPTNSSASVSFTADKAASYSVCIINIYGQEVSREQLNVVQGANTYAINVSSWAAGIYLFTLTDGKATKNHRFVVE